MEFRLPGVPPAALVDLHLHHALSESEYRSAVEWATKPPLRERWTAFFRDWFLVLGLLLVVAGVIVFGAFNWQALGRLQKLGLLELLVVATWLGSRVRGSDSPEGQGLLWAASLLVGALLAVFGQVYQTGADAFSLFLGWALLVTPWCLAGRSNLLWFTQAVLVNVAFTLYWLQRVELDFPWFALAYGLFNGLLAVAWERGRRRHPWLIPAMTDALLASGLTALTSASCTAFWGDWSAALCLLVTLVVLERLVRYYGHQVRRMALVASSVVVLASALSLRMLLQFQEFGLMLIGLAIVGWVSLAANWLKGIHARAASVAEAPDAAAPSAEVASAPVLAPADVLQQLSDNGLLEEAPTLAERRAMGGSPRYISVLVAFGAWVASWFFLAFVVLLISSSEGGLLLTGLLLWTGSTVWRNRSGDSSEFVAHLCLAVNIAGQLMAVIAIGLSSADDVLAASALALLLQGLGVLWFKDRTGRTLFAFASVVSGGILFWDATGGSGVTVWLLAVAYLLSRLWLGQRSWLLSRWRYGHGAVALGWSSGLLLMTGVWSENSTLFGFGDAPQPYYLTAGLTVLAIVNAVRLQAPPQGVAALLVLGAFTWSAPGVMAAMLVFLLASHTRSWGATRVAVLAMAFYGVLYYYNLDVTFLAKSMALLGSGAALLLARSLMKVEKSRYAF